MTESLIGFAAVMALIFLRVPIAFAMAAVGFVGYVLAEDLTPALSLTGQIVYSTARSYEFSVLPLFILMGNFVNRAGLSSELYAASNAFLGHRRGGLAMATIVACAGFGAVCGSSLATAATFSKVAMPSMRRYGYKDTLATGVIAAGGTLGILIPPSVVMVIYGFLADASIGKLFAAGVLPGVVATFFYLMAVRYVIWRDPTSGPRAERTAWPERWRALAKVWSVIFLFVVVMGGIYGGIFTPTEAAGIGAFGGFAFAVLKGGMTWRELRDVLVDSAVTSSLLFAILIGALIFANFINVVGFPQALIQLVKSLDVQPLTVILLILIVYLILGCILESISIILLTVPVFYPLVQSLGFDIVWFGIVVVCVIEISFLTPPIGMNVFVLRAMLPDVRTGTIFQGVTPFYISDMFRLAVVVLVPWLSLVLPNLFYGG
jgi:tripartite ATP-independent transporter DctM subunit